MLEQIFFKFVSNNSIDKTCFSALILYKVHNNKQSLNQSGYDIQSER